MVEPTHLTNTSQISSFPQVGGENKQYLKPPPRLLFLGNPFKNYHRFVLEMIPRKMGNLINPALSDGFPFQPSFLFREICSFSHPQKIELYPYSSIASDTEVWSFGSSFRGPNKYTSSPLVFGSLGYRLIHLKYSLQCRLLLKDRSAHTLSVFLQRS